MWEPSPPDHVPAELIVDFDFFDVPAEETDPTRIWHKLVEAKVPPIFYTPRNGGHWVFLRYADIVEGYRNHELFSTYQTPIPPIEPFPVVQPQGVDPPQHKVFRSLLAPLFTPTAIRALTEELRRRSAILIDSFAHKGGCDFIEDYAAQFPTGIFLWLMGLDENRLPEFLAMANTFFRSIDPAERAANIRQIYGAIDDLFDEKRRSPGDDWASTILAARDETGSALPYEDMRNCGFLLFAAGLDTVTNTLAYVWRYLATTPSAQTHFRNLLDDDAGFLIALEELMRINAVSNLFRRVTHDFTYRGVAMKKNDRLILPNTVANRDPSIFSDPDTIDLDRQVNTHVTFGVGPHRCIGSHLAKREVMVTMQEWLKRIPDFELDTSKPPATAFGGSVMGFTHLPLRWN